MLRIGFQKATAYSLISISFFSLDASACLAGMKADLAKCTTAKAPDAAKACSRILKSGRLPKQQKYIVYFNRGWAQRNNGQFEKALADFSRAISLNSQHADSYYSRSVVHYDLSNEHDALQDLDRYKTREKAKATALYKSALMLRRLNKLQMALSDLASASELSKKDDKIDTLQGILKSDLGDHVGALATLNPIIQRSPKFSPAYHARALVLYRQQRLAPAQSAAQKAIELDKRHTAAFTLLGLISEKQNRTDIARLRFEQAIMTDADSVESIYAQEEARDHLAALKQSPDENTKISQLPPKEQPKKCRRFIPSAAITIAVPCPR